MFFYYSGPAEGLGDFLLAIIVFAVVSAVIQGLRKDDRPADDDKGGIIHSETSGHPLDPQQKQKRYE